MKLQQQLQLTVAPNLAVLTDKHFYELFLSAQILLSVVKYMFI